MVASRPELLRGWFGGLPDSVIDEIWSFFTLEGALREFAKMLGAAPEAYLVLMCNDEISLGVLSSAARDFIGPDAWTRYKDWPSPDACEGSVPKSYLFLN